MLRDLSLLYDMFRAATAILDFKGTMDFQAFADDPKTQSAVIHQFLLVGEVAKLLSDGFKKAHPDVRWSAMARMRDKLIHHYRGVDLQEIFRAAETEVPRLVEFLRSQLPDSTQWIREDRER